LRECCNGSDEEEKCEQRQFHCFTVNVRGIGIETCDGSENRPAVARFLRIALTAEMSMLRLETPAWVVDEPRRRDNFCDGDG
jgi:hypothetical protein